MAENNNEVRLVSSSGDSIHCRRADTFLSRFMGLMGRDRLPEGQGLLIVPCNSIHMFFMKFAIDVAFLDKEYKIVKLVRNLAPGRIIGTVRGAFQAVEVSAGGMPESFVEGARLEVAGSS